MWIPNSANNEIHRMAFALANQMYLPLAFKDLLKLRRPHMISLCHRSSPRDVTVASGRSSEAFQLQVRHPRKLKFTDPKSVDKEDSL